MEAIKTTLNSVLTQLKDKRKAHSDSLDIQASLKKILTPRQLRHIKFSYLHKGVATIDVDSSSWAYEMNLHKNEYLKKLHKISRPGFKGGIKDIRFRLGDIHG